MKSYGNILSHGWNRVETYCPMDGRVWKHIVPCMESYGNKWYHASNHMETNAWNRMETYCPMDGIVWKHIVPLMEGYGNI